MSAPPLRMNQADVQTAICQTFRKTLTQLQFNNSMAFSGVDNDGHCSFFLQRTFDGVGKYTVIGHVKLWNGDHTFSTLYSIKASVLVSTNGSEPKITFVEPLTAKQL